MVLPFQAPSNVVKKFADKIKDPNRRKFAGMLTKLDESVGKVVEALQEQEMLDNTIIVFTTDNGGPAAGFDLNHASNWPLRGVSVFFSFFIITGITKIRNTVTVTI